VNDWFFAHAGNTRGRTVAELRSDLQRGVDASGLRAAILLSSDSLLEARLQPRPWWEAEDDTPARSEARLRGYLRALGVRHLVVGHQPGRVGFSDGTERRKGEMFQKFDGALFLIDVGMSRGVDGGGRGYSEGALLRIRSGPRAKAVAVYPDGSKRQLWQAH
jgi:hypothetical protein